MSRSELLEWIAMILIIILWWPVVFLNWGPPAYYYPLIVASVGGLLLIFARRMARMNQGFKVSEDMMRARRDAEERARGGKPTLDEKTPPDVSGQPPEDERNEG